jgi:hypothetical protein
MNILQETNSVRFPVHSCAQLVAAQAVLASICGSAASFVTLRNSFVPVRPCSDVGDVLSHIAGSQQSNAFSTLHRKSNFLIQFSALAHTQLFTAQFSMYILNFAASGFPQAYPLEELDKRLRSQYLAVEPVEKWILIWFAAAFSCCRGRQKIHMRRMPADVSDSSGSQILKRSVQDEVDPALYHKTCSALRRRHR